MLATAAFSLYAQMPRSEDFKETTKHHEPQRVVGVENGDSALI